MEVELSEAEQAKIREFALSIVNSFDASSKSRFGALLAQYLANSIKLHGLIKEVSWHSVFLVDITLSRLS